ncbi:hypothetical protein SPRG_22205 [Saprolegnia parasitica CBS 223.65]|uniref:ABC transporter domain-containing protein n=1 Tax=Saprolegnia parasitica (strain CBS 223.65) TaxID=695850 RepID=A0A067CCT6_SAPPC|nr:hypothetical protein SPRG_22205 [Saprolegnia parasitica CBS 223.65]KDO27000.1 hypothetical protein SPRG_22205 [Saprolegnia parasitica CBS 223.65]|eukprot:XP_012202418.1 hypothetical protein SPRG_22205 [Saprolegnia parasitica CBS 223.65]
MLCDDCKKNCATVFQPKAGGLALCASCRERRKAEGTSASAATGARRPSVAGPASVEALPLTSIAAPVAFAAIAPTALASAPSPTSMSASTKSIAPIDSVAVAPHPPASSAIEMLLAEIYRLRTVECMQHKRVCNQHKQVLALGKAAAHQGQAITLLQRNLTVQQAIAFQMREENAVMTADLVASKSELAAEVQGRAKQVDDMQRRHAQLLSMYRAAATNTIMELQATISRLESHIRAITHASTLTLAWHIADRSVQFRNPSTKADETKFIAIMGPSGAGKSSLLDIISGRVTSFHGSVTVNGQPWTPEVTRRTCYVMQDDLFYHTLTIFRRFDALYLLSHGQLVYAGQAASAVDYFGSIGVQCPAYMNPADFFMQEIARVDQLAHLVASWRAVAMPFSSNLADMPALDAPRRPAPRRRAGLYQWSVLCRRNLRRLVRDTAAFKARLAQSIVLALLSGLIYRDLGLSQSSIQSFAGALFFITLNQGMLAATSEFVQIPLELPLLRREASAGLYAPTTWYVAKNVSELWTQVVFPLLFVVPVFFLVGFGSHVDDPTSVLWTMYLFLSLVTSACVGLGYAISCAVPRPDVAPMVGIVALMPLVLFGGLLVNANDTPGALRCVQLGTELSDER